MTNIHSRFPPQCARSVEWVTTSIQVSRQEGTSDMSDTVTTQLYLLDFVRKVLQSEAFWCGGHAETCSSPFNHDPLTTTRSGTAVLALSTPRRHVEGAEVWLHTFLTSALGVGGQHHAPSALPPTNNPGTHVIRGVAEK